MVNYTRFVQAGRVAYIAFGPGAKKIAMIVEIIDQNRVLVDGPCSGVQRRPINIKRLHLTKILCRLPHGCGTEGVRKVWTNEKVDEQWKKSVWARKLARKAIRANLTDFERFQVMVARQKCNRLIRTFRASKSSPKKVAKPAAVKKEPSKPATKGVKAPKAK